MPPSLLNLLRCCFLFISVHPLPNNQTYSPSHSPITQSPSNFYTTLPPTDQSHTKIVDAEASGKHLVINCGTGCIRIVHASYGMNCNITLTNDELLSLQNACNNRTICTYEITFMCSFSYFGVFFITIKATFTVPKLQSHFHFVYKFVSL
eukprot:1067883_1